MTLNAKMTMSDLQRYPDKNVENMFCLSDSKSVQSWQFLHELTQMNLNSYKKKNIIFSIWWDKDFNVIRALPTLHGRSLEITLTVPFA